MQHNIKLTISYDGTRYHGWQSQKQIENTIQNRLETMLTRYIGEEISLSASGRTDAGVHALAQVANFHTSQDVDLDQLRNAFYEYLPQDIVVTDICEVDSRFHARLSAVSKRYRYRIWNSPQLDVFQRSYVWQLPDLLDVSAMRQAAKYLTGTHDFLSFCSLKRMKKSSVRTVTDIAITERKIPYGKELLLDFTGNGFLYNMVRILTGTLVEVGQGKRLPGEMPDILKARKRQAAGMTAPPMGLMLMEVHYKMPHTP